MCVGKADNSVVAGFPVDTTLPLCLPAKAITFGFVYHK